jgi:hypothetical protein
MKRVLFSFVILMLIATIICFAVLYNVGFRTIENSFVQVKDKPAGSKVPVSKKIYVTNMLLSKLSPSDISELKGILSNGITAEENRRVKEIVYSRLSADEINKIIAIKSY